MLLTLCLLLIISFLSLHFVFQATTGFGANEAIGRKVALA